MPSVRPKLVQEGAPIEGGVVSEIAKEVANNDQMTTEKPEFAGGTDTRYVIGGGTNNNNAGSSSLMNASSLTLNSSMNIGVGSMDIAGRRRSSAATATGKKSSLAQAAKGTLMGTSKPSTRKSGVQTTFVVGGGGGASSSIPDEKKSNGMSMDNDSPTNNNTNTNNGGGGRKSSTTTSFQVPSSSSYNNNDNNHSVPMMEHDHEEHSPMELDPKPVVAHKFVVAPTSSSQAPAYIEPITTTTTNNNNMNNNHSHSHEVHNNPHRAHDDPEVEKMEGVIDLSEKAPMVVLDGANIAYAYDKAGQGGDDANDKPMPDARGIVVACEYFLNAGIRVLAVIPSTWMHRDPYQRILKKLEKQGLLVAAPSRDDDDAYAITIARREDAKSKERGQHGPGYVLSNDMFRDAMMRGKAQGGGADLVSWLMQGSTRASGETGPGRISYSFCDTGSMDDHGDKILDIVPNPRHPLVQMVEQKTSWN